MIDWIGEIIPLPDKMSWAEQGRIHRLSCYRDAKNALQGLTISDIAQIIKMSERQAIAFMNKMTKLKVVAKEDGMYVINPLYF